MSFPLKRKLITYNLFLKNGEGAHERKLFEIFIGIK